MMDNDIYTRLNGIFRDLFMRDDIFLKPGTTALDIEGWDSFRHIGDLVGFIEAHLQAG